MTDEIVEEIEDEADAESVEAPLVEVSVGARYLVRKEYGAPSLEVLVESVSPSRRHIKFDRLGWQPAEDYEIIERLSPAPATTPPA